MGDMTHPCPKCDASLSYSVTVHVAPEHFLSKQYTSIYYISENDIYWLQ